MSSVSYTHLYFRNTKKEKLPRPFETASLLAPYLCLLYELSLIHIFIIHEGGHFLFARLFKVRVEKFCLQLPLYKTPCQTFMV